MISLIFRSLIGCLVQLLLLLLFANAPIKFIIIIICYSRYVDRCLPFTVYCIFLACTNLLISLNVVSIAGCSVSVKLEHFLFILWQFFPSCPSRAARIYLKNRNISTLSDVGFRSSFSSLFKCANAKGKEGEEEKTIKKIIKRNVIVSNKRKRNVFFYL